MLVDLTTVAVVVAAATMALDAAFYVWFSCC